METNHYKKKRNNHHMWGNKYRVGKAPWNKGKKTGPLNPETKIKLSIARKGNTNGFKTGADNLNYTNGKSGTKEMVCFYARRYQIRKKKADGSHTIGEWELLKKQYGFICPCCGRREPKIKLTEDHIIPLVRGGTDYIENIQPLCSSCNSRKHTKIVNYGKPTFSRHDSNQEDIQPQEENPSSGGGNGSLKDNLDTNLAN